MGKYQVSVTKNCDSELSKIGTITYKPKLTNTFLFFKSDETAQRILEIDGVEEVHDEEIFSIS